MENKREINWDELLEMLEEWFANGTRSFEEAHAKFITELNSCSNLEEEAFFLKKLRVMGFLRRVICWHQASQSQQQLPQEGQQ